eukprot:s876_g11.t1
MRATYPRTGTIEQSIPVFHATDNYTLQMIWSRRQDLTLGCTIVGDPQHDCINLAKVLHFRASRQENIMEDHAETADYPVPEHDISDPPHRSGPGWAYALPVLGRQLSKEIIALVWSACIDPLPKWQHVFQQVEAFVILHQVQEFKVWVPAFKGFPPRWTLERIAKRFGADLHPTCQPYGFEREKEIGKEIRRIMRWYKHGKKTMQPELAEEQHCKVTRRPLRPWWGVRLARV